MTSDQTIADQSVHWSDCRLTYARDTVCSRSALKVVSNQNLLDENDLWSDQNQTIVQTIVRPCPRSKTPKYISKLRLFLFTRYPVSLWTSPMFFLLKFKLICLISFSWSYFDFVIKFSACFLHENIVLISLNNGRLHWPSNVALFTLLTDLSWK